MKKQVLYRAIGMLFILAVIVSTGGLAQPEHAEAEYLRKYVDKFGTGSSNCSAAPSSWTTSSCGPNAMQRFATDSNLAVRYKTALSKCYWKDGSTTGCYYPGDHDKEVRLAGVWNSSLGFGHFVASRYKSGDRSNFHRWGFYQYEDMLIQRGEWQMPCGSDTEKTKVVIYDITSLNSGCGADTNEYKTWYIDKDCKVSTSKNLASDQDKMQLLSINNLKVKSINAKVAKLKETPSLQMAWWMTEVDTKQVHIWVIGLTPENQKLNGTLLDGWKVNVWEDQLTKRLAAEQK